MLRNKKVNVIKEDVHLASLILLKQVDMFVYLYIVVVLVAFQTMYDVKFKGTKILAIQSLCRVFSP